MNGSDKFNYHLGCVLLFLAQNWKREKADDWVVVIGSVQLFRCVCVRKHALGLQLSYQIFFTIYIDSCQFFMTSWRCYSRHVFKNIFEDPKAVSACGWACTFHCVQVYACWLLYAAGMINWCYCGWSPQRWFMKWYMWSRWESVCCLGEVRSGVVAGSHSVGEEHAQQRWQWLYVSEGKGEVMVRVKMKKEKQISVKSVKRKQEACCLYFGPASLSAWLFSSSAQLLLVTELIVNWSKEWLKKDS